ncbi:MAG: hypothetical protein ACK449_16380 [Planctomycetota bacterium]
MSTTISGIDQPGANRSGATSNNPDTHRQEIHAWVRKFGIRQALVLLVQGLSVAILCMIACASIIVLLDTLRMIDDPTRYALSLGMYALSIGVGLWFGIARWWRTEDPIQLAKHVEHASPQLNESLLSALELDRTPVEKRHFSPEFLAAIQRNVAQQLQGLSIPKMLPWSLVGRVALSALGAIGFVIALCGLPGMEMPTRFARAFLPFMDIQRPSKSKILVLSPAQSPSTVPENQSVSFEIEVQGAPTQDAYLETRLASKGRYATPERLPMNLVQHEPLMYATAVALSNEALEYRFVSGDAVSAYRKLTTTPRPKVTRFHQSIDFPEYTKVPKSSRSSDRGDARLLSGSKLQIAIEPSMPLTSASLSIDDLDSGEKQTLAMHYDNPSKRWSIDVPAQRDLRYQVKLIAEVSGAEAPIENTFSPFYEVDVIDDQSPNVSWMVGDQTLMEAMPSPNQMWIVSPHEFVKLAAAVADDLPNASLRQEISVNRQPYKSLDLPAELTKARDKQANFLSGLVTWTPLDGIADPTRSTALWSWDLLSESLSSGDVIAVRMAATDSAGQVGYSIPIQLSLASEDFDRNRHQALYFRSVLGPDLQKLADLVRTQRAVVRPKMLLLKDPKLDEPTRRNISQELKEFTSEWIKLSDRIRALATQLVSKLPRPLDQSETEFVLRAVSKLQREHATSVALAANVEAWTPMEVAGKGAIVPDKLAQLLQQQIDRSIAALDDAEGSTARLSEIYKQLLGHEYLTAMTKDLMVLRDHQRNQLAKADKLDFVGLARTQTIADQYIEGAMQLASKMDPYLAQNLRDQSKNLIRFLDQSRQEIRDLAQAEPTPQALSQLRQRIERSHVELNGQHWAFNLDGGMLWNISDVRRDLIIRGSGVGNSLQRTLDTLSKTAEWASDTSLDSEVLGRLRSATLDELTTHTLPGSDQITDRRDFHLQRKPVDPLFPSDMGLASRAWSTLVENWLDLPTGTGQWTQMRDDLKSIAQAYRVLEAAHELQDMRLVLDTLRKQEQYDWQTAEGKLSHLRQWDSMNHRFDLTHTWMKESGYPGPIADKLNAIRWGAIANSIRQKLDPRRSANNETMLNAAPELQELLGDFDAIVAQAQPTIEAARKLLAQFSPTVSKLAQVAAQKTKDLQEKTKNPETSPQENAKEQEQVDQSIEKLQEALLEMATKQDILNAAQLQAAKDSDRALNMIDQVQEPMARANQQLLDAQNHSQDANTVAQAAQEAAQKQQQAAETFETIAKHFERVEEALANPQPSNLAAADASRSQLQPKQQETPSNPQNNSESQQPSKDQNADMLAQAKDLLDNYQKADQLSELAKNSPEELLKLLEAELRRNQPMQNELSDISKQTVRDAAAELQNASQRESNLAQQLENSDSQTMDSKAVQAQQLKALAQNAENLAASVLNKAQTPIQRINQQELRKDVAAVSNALLNAARQAQSADPNASQKSLQEKTDQLVKEVQKAQQQLGAMNPNLNQLVDQNNFKEDKQRQAQLTEAQSSQSLMRDDQIRQTKDMSRRREQLANQLAKESENRDKELQQKNNERNKTLEALQKKPEDAGLQAQMDQKTRETFQAMQRANSAKQLAQAAQEIANNAKQQEQRTEQAQRANLDTPNPMAALAREQINAAKEQLDQLNNQLQGLQGQVNQPPQRTPTAEALAQGEPTQQGVEQTVDQIADQLARSARHEERLNNQKGSQQLNQQAQQVQQQVKGTVDRASDQIDQAAKQAKEQMSNQLQQARQNGSPQPQRAPNAEAPLAALNQAQQSLAQQASELSGISSAMEQPPGTQPPGTQPPGTQPPGTQPQGTQPQGTQPQGTQPQGTQPQGSQPQGTQPQGTQPQGTQPQGTQPQGTQPQGTQPQGTQPQGTQPQGSQPQGSQPQGSLSQAIPQSAKELARLLDSLDSQLAAEQLANSDGSQKANSENSQNNNTQNAQNAQANPQGQPNSQQDGQPQDSNPSNSQKSGSEKALADAANQIASQLQSQRLANRNAAKQRSQSAKKPSSESSSEPDDMGRTEGQPVGNSALPNVMIDKGIQWGKLREQRAEQVIEGKREFLDPEFGEAIRAYYRALGKQGLEKSPTPSASK